MRGRSTHRLGDEIVDFAAFPFDDHRSVFDYSRIMELLEASNLLASLAQPSRLEVFRLLAQGGETGMCAGDIARNLGVPKNTLSFHLKELTQSGLITSERSGRSIIYSLETGRMQELMQFLTEDCCQGRPDLCLPTDCAASSCAAT